MMIAILSNWENLSLSTVVMTRGGKVKERHMHIGTEGGKDKGTEKRETERDREREILAGRFL